MKEIIYNYLIQAILGGASGYITNDYAINMLFKEYTPFKIGGVIKKTRKEFTDNISSLVENDIINKDKLNEILMDENFKAEFEKLTKDFFSKNLYNFASTDKFSNIEGINNSIENTGNFIIEMLDKHLYEVLNLINSYFKIDEILNKEQLNTIWTKLYDSLFITIKDNNAIEEILSSLYDNNKTTKLNQVLSDKDKVSEIIKQFIDNLNLFITDNYNEKTDCFFKDIYSDLELRQILNNSKNILHKKNIKDIIQINKQSRNKILKLFLKYINSEKGQFQVNNLCDSLFTYVKKSDKTLFEIIDLSFEVKIKSYLVENLPNLTKNIVKWVNLNNININKIIQDSIDETIEQSDGIKGTLLNMLKDSYLKNLSEKYDIVDKIIEFIQNEKNNEQLSSNISKSIIEYLNNHSINEIISILESNNIITPEKLTKYILKYINNYAETIFKELLNYLLLLKVEDLFSKTEKSKDNNKDLFLFPIVGMIKKRMFSTNYVTDSLSKKLYCHINNILDEDLSNLINRDDFIKKLPSIQKYTLDLIEKNNDYLNNLIINTIQLKLKDKDILFFDHDYISISKLVVDSSIKNYYSFTNIMLNKNISNGIDKINLIDNLYLNSSETLRVWIVNNLDNVLGSSVKNIVEVNLNKLSDDELCDLANDFIGRELRPIMFFGGILGTVAGTSLAIYQNSPINASLFTLENMLIYSLVGFFTNVIAINMIFKPYKKIKILDKIPFLNNFSLGYIVKNQSVFAENMSNLINENLLSKESINEIFVKYEQSIKENINTAIGTDDYYMIKNLVNNNRESIVSNSFNFTKALISNNLSHISNFSFNKLDNINLSLLSSDKNISTLSNMATNSVINKNHALSCFFSEKIKTLNNADNMISKFLLIQSKNSLYNFTSDYYAKTSLNLSNYENVKSFFMKYNTKYENEMNKPINTVFSPALIVGIEELISKKVVGMASSTSTKQKITNLFTNLINKSFNPNKRVDELFNGKVKQYIESNLPLFFNRMADMIKKSIYKSKKNVSFHVQSEIKQNISFLEKGMYTIMGGDNIVDEVIDKIISKKLPDFIDDKKDELFVVLSSSLNEKLYNAKVEKLYTGINSIQINDMINDYFFSLENIKKTDEKIIKMIHTLSEKLENLNIGDILNTVSLNSVNRIFNTYEEEIKSIIFDLSNNMTSKKYDIMKRITLLSNEIIDEFIISDRFKDLLSQITKDDIALIVENLFNILNRDDFINKTINNFLLTYKNNTLKSEKMSDFINKEELINYTESLLRDIIDKDETKNIVKEIYNSIIKKASESNFDFIDDDTKTYFVNMFVESSIDSIKENLDTILKSVEFDKIAKEEIENMEPKKIHQMFNSFGEKYFRKLMLYGLGGFIFGINIYIGLALTGLKITKERFSK